MGRIIPHWARLRKEILNRDGRKCVKCGSSKRLNVDHKVAIGNDGSKNDKDNLQTLCHKCHAAKTITDKDLMNYPIILENNRFCVLINGFGLKFLCQKCKIKVLDAVIYYELVFPAYIVKEDICCCNQVIIPKNSIFSYICSYNNICEGKVDFVDNIERIKDNLKYKPLQNKFRKRPL